MGVASENCALVLAKALPNSLTLPPESHPPPQGQPTDRRVHPSLASQPSCSHWGVTSKEAPKEQRDGGPRDCGKVPCGH